MRLIGKSKTAVLSSGFRLDKTHDWSQNVSMARTLAAAEFKAKCLAILDDVDADGIIITKHGKPVAKLMPIQPSSIELIGRLKGKLEIKGDVLSTGLNWDVEP
jgi:prevent-host-death family protein